MKNLFTIIALFFTLTCQAQYSEWQFEDRDSLYRQYNYVWEQWDYYRTDANYSPAEMAKFRGLGEWCGYKIECYLDSIQTEYAVYLIGGKEIYQLPGIDPGFYQGYTGSEVLTERRTPTFAGFMQYKLERMDWWLLFTPYVKIPANK